MRGCGAEEMKNVCGGFGEKKKKEKGKRNATMRPNRAT